ncbi:MAG: YolD-like family protein [Clostridia bacterium]|nr:YolD-like family protein [Clostridia bacterium]
MAKRKPKSKMPISERAKQFAPFSPLNGLEEALAEKERVMMPKKALSDDAIALIGRTLSLLEVGETITVFYYNSYETVYTQIFDTVRVIDRNIQCLFVGDEMIPFEDIYEIQRAKTGEPFTF